MIDYSTQWLKDPAVAPALPGLLAGLILRMRRVLQSGWAPAERLAAIAEELDGIAPPPPPYADDDGPAYGRELIALRLATSTSPATMLFSALAGCPVTFSVWTSGCVRLTDLECSMLDAEPGTWAAHRRGTFQLNGRVLADVTSSVITERLPSEAVASLQAGTPLGAVLAAFGRREPLSVLPWNGGLASSARMWITHHGRQVRVALAEERIHPWFCERDPAASAALLGDPGVQEPKVPEEVHDGLGFREPEPAAAGVQV